MITFVLTGDACLHVKPRTVMSFLFKIQQIIANSVFSPYLRQSTFPVTNDADVLDAMDAVFHCSQYSSCSSLALLLLSLNVD
jgi:hypothetical protein